MGTSSVKFLQLLKCSRWFCCLIIAAIIGLDPNVFVKSWSPHHQQVKNAKLTFLSAGDSNPYRSILMAKYGPSNYDFEDLEDLEDLEEPPILSSFDSYEEELSPADVKSLTVTQLKQQLRLRGLKVSGKKSELVERLVASHPENIHESEQSEPSSESSTGVSSTFTSEATPKNSKARRVAEKHGKELVDVTDYLDEDDQGKDFKSSTKEDPEDDEVENVNSASNPEVWGSEAKIVDDYEGRRLVVDTMMQTIVEFKGSNQTYLQSYVVASRDALRAFLAGGTNNNETMTPAEERLRHIQVQREQAEAAKTSLRALPGEDGLDEGDESGLYKNVMHREFSDWGKYTVTGAQLSAQEVQGILFLSDVYGPFSNDTKALADKIAFECQPVVVMAPDLFRGDPWKGEVIDGEPSGFDEKGRTYEEWRASHSDIRVGVDIRAAAAVLREKYGVSSVVVWGTCYGGGRALEQAAGVLPDGNIHDIDGRVGPPPVDPMAAVAWYPTRYNARALFGSDPEREDYWTNTADREFAVMAVFAGEDTIPGATLDDAQTLKALLEKDERVKDHMVKVFPERDHSFAHMGLAQTDEERNDFTRFVDNEFGGAGRVAMHEGDAEVACLLSTAFMETYSRVFLPTVGPRITQDVAASEWNENLEMKQTGRRDVRQEIEDAESNFVEEPLGANMIDPAEIPEDDAQLEELEQRLRAMQSDDISGPFKIEEDDGIELMLAKLAASDENFQLW